MKRKNNNLVVRKSNDLIQKSRFNLSIQQQKIMSYIISLIQPTDKEFHEYSFPIKEFCKCCGIDDHNGGNYEDIKEQIQNIANKSVWILFENGKDALVRWIEKAYIKNGIVTVRLDDDLKPYLLELRNNYTTYELIWTMSFNSKYTFRLYEFVKSIHYNELEEYTRLFSLEEIQRLLGAEVYNEWYDFKRRVFEPSILEVNRISDKQVTYKPIKEGRKVVAIVLTITSIIDTAERTKRMQAIENG